MGITVTVIKINIFEKEKLFRYFYWYIDCTYRQLSINKISIFIECVYLKAKNVTSLIILGAQKTQAMNKKITFYFAPFGSFYSQRHHFNIFWYYFY